MDRVIAGRKYIERALQVHSFIDLPPDLGGFHRAVGRRAAASEVVALPRFAGLG